MRLPSGKRLKWEPAAAMALVLALGLWLAVGPLLRPRVDLRPGATSLQFRIGENRRVVEYLATPAPGEPQFRVLDPDEKTESLTDAEARKILGEYSYRQLTSGGQNWVFRVLNITSW